jgi:hypothetical protein
MTRRLIVALLLLVGSAQAQTLFTDINANNTSSAGANCTVNPNDHVTEPGWEWQNNSNPLGLVSPGTVSSPSLDGQAREFDWCWGSGCTSYNNPTWGCNGTPVGGTYGGALFHSDLNPGNPDETDAEFTWSGWFQYTAFSPTAIDNVEMDMNQIVDSAGDVVIYAMQCDLTSVPAYWEFVNGWKITTPLTCPRSQWTLNTWHHLVIEEGRSSTCVVNNCTITLHSITFDNNTQTCTPGAWGSCTSTCTTGNCRAIDALGWSPPGGLILNVQFGVGNNANGTNTAYGDLIQVHSGSPTTVATPTFTPSSCSSPCNVTIACGGATCCYTKDGSTPTVNHGGTCTGSTLTYTSPIAVSASLTINAIGTEDGVDFDSTQSSATYNLSNSAPAPSAPLFAELFQ